MANSLQNKTELELVIGNELGALMARLHNETVWAYDHILDTIKDVLYNRNPIQHEFYRHTEQGVSELVQRLSNEGWKGSDIVTFLRRAVSRGV